MDRRVSQLAFEEIEAGMTFKESRRFSIEDVMAFAEMSGDFSPLHVDADYAAGTEFGARVIHGMLLASLFSRLVGMKIPGESALYVGQDLAFRRPVLVGEKVTAIAKVTGKTEATRTLVLATEIRNEKEEIVVSGSAKVKVREDVNKVQRSPTERPSRSSLSDARAVLVTGASRGIGAGIARLLGEKGYSVVVNYCNSRPQATTVAEDIKNAGGDAIAIQADVRDRDAVDQMMDGIAAEIGRLDCVVNGAIGEIHTTQFSDLTWQDFQGILEYQLKAVINVCQASYALLQQGAHPSIVNILSQVTHGVPPSQMADYVAGKYALQGLSKALAAEWAGDKIRVNTVSPGMIQTDLTLHYHERVFKMEAARTPMKRIATVDDVAECVAFLLSEQSTFITGADVSLTGGQVMR